MATMTLFGLTSAELEGLAALGCPVDDEGRAQAWLALQSCAKSRAEGAPDPDATWRDGRARRAVTAAEREARELALLKEQWIERSEVQALYSAECARLRDALQGGLCERLVGLSGPEIRAELGRVLRGLSQGLAVEPDRGTGEGEHG